MGDITGANFQEELIKQASNPEPLHEDLQPYLEESLGWSCLRHPLVFGVPYAPQFNFMYNQQYSKKKEFLEESRQEKNWYQFVYLHERPYRFNAFVEIMHDLTGERYWSILSSVWSDSENLWQIGNKVLRLLLKAPREGRENFMDDDENTLMENLPNRFRVFRGHQRRNAEGFSWTLSYPTAVWFAQ